MQSLFKMLTQIRHHTRKSLEIIPNYFDQMWFHHKRRLLVVRVLQFYLAIALVLCAMKDLSELSRLILYDVMLINGIGQRFNWITLVLTLNVIYFQRNVYSPSERFAIFLWKFWFGRVESAERFFVQSLIRDHRGKSCSVVYLIKRYTSYWISFNQYFILFTLSVISIYHVAFLVWLCRYYLISLLLGNPIGYLQLIIFCACALSFDTMLYTYAQVHIIWSIITVNFILIFFLKLSQVNRLFLLPANRVNLNRFSSVTLNHFIRHHTRTLLVIFLFNTFVGKLLLMFIVISFPLNSYLVIAVLTGQLKGLALFVFCNCILGQYIVILGFHLLGAMFSSRIHKCSRGLFHCSENSKNRHQMTLRGRIRMFLYVDKFSTRNRYGITYGPLRLLVTFNSFGKSMILYVKLLIYWMKLFRA